MKKILFVSLFVLFLAACGGEAEESGSEADASETATEETSASESTETMTEEENENKEASVGDTIKNESGETTLVSRTDDVGTFETGPIVLNIKKVNGASAKFNSETAEILGSENVEYIQVDVEVENTSEENVTFYPSQATLTTSTGEQLEPDMLMSEHIDGEFIGAVKKSGTNIYILENSKAEDVESVRLIYSAPVDENYEDIGEEIDTEVTLQK